MVFMTLMIRMHVNCFGSRCMSTIIRWVSMPGGWMPANRMYVTVPIWNIGRLCADLRRWVPLRNFSMLMHWWMQKPFMTVSVEWIIINVCSYWPVRDLPGYSVILQLHGAEISVHVGRIWRHRFLPDLISPWVEYLTGQWILAAFV